MCDPMTAIAIGNMAIGAFGAITDKGKGKEIEYSPMNKQGNEQQNQLMKYLMGRIGQSNPFAKVNPMSMNAMNMASQYYTGSPYTHPGYGQSQGGNPFGSPAGNPRTQMGRPGMGQPGMGGPGGGQSVMGGGRASPQPFRQ